MTRHRQLTLVIGLAWFVQFSERCFSTPTPQTEKTTLDDYAQNDYKQGTDNSKDSPGESEDIVQKIDSMDDEYFRNLLDQFDVTEADYSKETTKDQTHDDSFRDNGAFKRASIEDGVDNKISDSTQKKPVENDKVQQGKGKSLKKKGKKVSDVNQKRSGKKGGKRNKKNAKNNQNKDDKPIHKEVDLQLKIKEHGKAFEYPTGDDGMYSEEYLDKTVTVKAENSESNLREKNGMKETKSKKRVNKANSGNRNLGKDEGNVPNQNNKSSGGNKKDTSEKLEKDVTEKNEERVEEIGSSTEGNIVEEEVKKENNDDIDLSSKDTELKDDKDSDITTKENVTEEEGKAEVNDDIDLPSNNTNLKDDQGSGNSIDKYEEDENSDSQEEKEELSNESNEEPVDSSDIDKHEDSSEEVPKRKKTNFRENPGVEYSEEHEDFEYIKMIKLLNTFVEHLSKPGEERLLVANFLNRAFMSDDVKIDLTLKNIVENVEREIIKDLYKFNEDDEDDDEDEDEDEYEEEDGDIFGDYNRLGHGRRWKNSLHKGKKNMFKRLKLKNYRHRPPCPTYINKGDRRKLPRRRWGRNKKHQQHWLDIYQYPYQHQYEEYGADYANDDDNDDYDDYDDVSAVNEDKRKDYMTEKSGGGTTSKDSDYEDRKDGDL